MDIEDISSCKKTLKIEISAEDVTKEFDEAYEEVRKKAEIPGFRKGKAPRSVIKMRFAEYIKADVIDKLVPPAFEEAAKDAELDVLRPPDAAKDIEPPFEELSVEPGEPLRFEVTIDVKPEIIIPDLGQLQVEKGEVNVPREDVDSYLELLREERADFVPVEDRPVQEGDYATLDLLLTSGDETLTDEEQVLQVNEDMEIPELVQHLVGMNSGDEKKFSISFPEDHKAENVAGKEVDFQISLQKVTEKHLPALDDDFARDLDEDDLDHLVAKTWNQLVETTKQGQREKQQDDLMEQLLEKSEFDVPEFMIEERAKLQLRIDTVLSQREDVEPSEEELEQYNEAALKAIRTGWLLNEIAERENIEVTDAEVDASIRQVAQERGRDPQKYRKVMEDANRIEGLKTSIWEQKIFDHLIEQAGAKQTLIT